MGKERLLRTDVATDFIFPVEVIVKTRLIKYLNDSITEIDKSSSDLYDHEGIAYGAGQKSALEKIKKELEGR